MVPVLNNDLVIFDQSIALISPGLSMGGRAVMIKEAAVIAFLCRVFQESWERGTVLADSRKSQNEAKILANAIKGTVLRMLIQGFRDETIARRMDISVRTCRRHIAEMMEQVGAKSRFQAGDLVAGHQLLDAQDVTS